MQEYFDQFGWMGAKFAGIRAEINYLGL